MFAIITGTVSEETFTFTPEGEEQEIHILSGQLRQWLHTRAMDKIIDLHFPEQSLDDLIRQHGLEEPRMRSMTLEEAYEPVIVGIHPSGTHILIDGGHRRWFWAKRGLHTLRGWAVPTQVWEIFQFDPAAMGVVKHHRDGSMLPQRRGK
jgi:hypothetical protein